MTNNPLCPKRHQRPNADIYIVSYGIYPERDLTLESYELLRDASEIYTILPSPILKQFLESHDITYIDISSLYVDGMLRSAIYAQIASRVLERSLISPNICYLTYGNPMCFDTPVSLILSEARKRGLSTYVSPSLSFLDMILARGQIPIGVTGMQLFEATGIIKGNMSLNPLVPSFIAQIGALFTDTADGASAMSLEKLSLLVEHLRTFYPANHLITLCDSDESGCQPMFFEIPLCALPMVYKGISNATTLYIPPVANT